MSRSAQLKTYSHSEYIARVASIIHAIQFPIKQQCMAVFPLEWAGYHIEKSQGSDQNMRLSGLLLC